MMVDIRNVCLLKGQWLTDYRSENQIDLSYLHAILEKSKSSPCLKKWWLSISSLVCSWASRQSAHLRQVSRFLEGEIYEDSGVDSRHILSKYSLPLLFLLFQLLHPLWCLQSHRHDWSEMERPMSTISPTRICTMGESCQQHEEAEVPPPDVRHQHRRRHRHQQHPPMELWFARRRFWLY